MTFRSRQYGTASGYASSVWHLGLESTMAFRPRLYYLWHIGHRKYMAYSQCMDVSGLE